MTRTSLAAGLFAGLTGCSHPLPMWSTDVPCSCAPPDRTDPTLVSVEQRVDEPGPQALFAYEPPIEPGHVHWIVPSDAGEVVIQLTPDDPEWDYEPVSNALWLDADFEVGDRLVWTYRTDPVWQP